MVDVMVTAEVAVELDGAVCGVPVGRPEVAPENEARLDAVGG
jgi:hypothetical protein